MILLTPVLAAICPQKKTRPGIRLSGVNSGCENRLRATAPLSWPRVSYRGSDLDLLAAYKEIRYESIDHFQI